ncbi:hypothetical protein [Pseudomonas luteola]|nr:hypothetical protein [Pseudomonas luteola]
MRAAAFNHPVYESRIAIRLFSKTPFATPTDDRLQPPAAITGLS